MMKKYALLIAVLIIVGGLGFTSTTSASHSWGGYHWARTANPFTLKLNDNVTNVWDSYLITASNEWSLSSVLHTNIVRSKTNPKNCQPIAGQVQVCNSKYGNNGWLGVAQIWINGMHITQGVAKMNDTYFNTPTYNKPAWKNLVMCQEIAHAFGLAHQDEGFDNTNLGSCMDYTNDPDGTLKNQLDNQYPNQHDYDELEAIYAHLDSFTTFNQSTFSGSGNSENSLENPSDWGQAIAKDASGRDSVFLQDFGGGKKKLTHVFWTEETRRTEKE